MEIKTDYYVKLKDLYTPFKTAEVYQYYEAIPIDDLKGVLVTYGFNVTALSNFVASDNYVLKFWNFFSSRFQDEIIFKQDHELDLTNDEDEKNICNFFNNFFNIFNFTLDRFKTILTLYDQQKTNLLNKIQSTSASVARFNDTPQNIEVEGISYIDDKFTSTINKNDITTSTDRDTLIERLDSIEQKFSNVLLKWTNEFHKIFIEGGN